ncbi:NADH dehydrogenase Fe-S protein subunit 4 ndufs4 [Cichlidogyrus casuarinus]|uniref:NADH dehydrogenase [ubiquinone] iron-sulfur protein 4, mitochondrial n=1 Tax=Cichlidogyrus casuarinus TaxID=1844966 RepID=A0ABD2PY70_9PLAT
MTSSQIQLARKVNSLLVQTQRYRSVTKATPQKMNFEMRVKLENSQFAKYRTRLEDSSIEAKEIMRKPKDFSREDRITISEDPKVDVLNGVPEEHKSGRRVRIYQPTKAATQSGTYSTTFWQLEFDNRERWENPLMGWSSTGDPLSNLTVKFESAEMAQEFCEQQGWPCYIDKPNKPFLKAKSYGANFSWNKRTRTGNK